MRVFVAEMMRREQRAEEIGAGALLASHSGRSPSLSAFPGALGSGS
jgi:hypothetical protein